MNKNYVDNDTDNLAFVEYIGKLMNNQEWSVTILMHTDTHYVSLKNIRISAVEKRSDNREIIHFHSVEATKIFEEISLPLSLISEIFVSNYIDHYEENQPIKNDVKRYEDLGCCIIPGSRFEEITEIEKKPWQSLANLVNKKITVSSYFNKKLQNYEFTPDIL